jgi:multisubunit Na+/H+ antiporter MnhB subunit
LKIFYYIIILTFGAILIYATLEFPKRGPRSEVLGQETNIVGSELPSTYYIRNAYKDANTPNIVTVVLGDYRSIDTLGEEAVIFTAGIICYLLLMREKQT